MRVIVSEAKYSKYHCNSILGFYVQVSQQRLIISSPWWPIKGDVEAFTPRMQRQITVAP